MDFTLAPNAVAAGHGLVAYDTIGSTNIEAMALLRAGEGAPLWVVSRHQTEGRGRRGNAWQTESGNLAASLALVLDAEPAAIATLGFVAGVALVRSLERPLHRPADGPPPPQAGEEPGSPQDRPPLAGEGGHAKHGGGGARRFTLKWPNDVLADGGKLAGILLETEQLARGRQAVVVGIGVNVAHAPGGLAYPTASLAGLGRPIQAERLFEALSAAWTEMFRIWDGGRGFPAIRAAWLAQSAGLGGPINVGGAHGIFETIDAHGQLVLRRPDGSTRAISAGEVHFGDAAMVRAENAA